MTSKRVNEVVKQVKTWPYVPSNKCLQDTFDISYTQAQTVLHNL
jgi:hypothetical protein